MGNFSRLNSSAQIIDSVGAGNASYEAVVNNSLGIATLSNMATLNLSVAPTIATNPTNRNVLVGILASFSAVANDNPTPVSSKVSQRRRGKEFW